MFLHIPHFFPFPFYNQHHFSLGEISSHIPYGPTSVSHGASPFPLFTLHPHSSYSGRNMAQVRLIIVLPPCGHSDWSSESNGSSMWPKLSQIESFPDFSFQNGDRGVTFSSFWIIGCKDIGLEYQPIFLPDWQNMSVQEKIRTNDKRRNKQR